MNVIKAYTSFLKVFAEVLGQVGESMGRSIEMQWYARRGLWSIHHGFNCIKGGSSTCLLRLLRRGIAPAKVPFIK